MGLEVDFSLMMEIKMEIVNSERLRMQQELEEKKLLVLLEVLWKVIIIVQLKVVVWIVKGVRFKHQLFGSIGFGECFVSFINSFLHYDFQMEDLQVQF